MKFFKILPLLILFIGFYSFTEVDDTKSKEILTKVSEKIQSYKNVKIDFTHQMIDEANGIDESIKGTIIMKGKSINLKMMGQTIISDGKTVWSYNPEFEELQIMNADEGSEALNFFDLIVNFDESFKTQLIKTITEEGQSFYIIDLRPKEGKAYYKIRVKINTKTHDIKSGTIFNKDKAEFRYTVDNLEPNVNVTESTFTFNEADYPDADIIDLR